MNKRWTMLAFVVVASACSSASLEEQACDQIRATADCMVDDPEAERAMCVAGFEQLSEQNEALGCGEEFDAFLECIARTQFRCSGDNFPECHDEATAWTACCSAGGMTCPTLM